MIGVVGEGWGRLRRVQRRTSGFPCRFPRSRQFLAILSVGIYPEIHRTNCIRHRQTPCFSSPAGCFRLMPSWIFLHNTSYRLKNPLFRSLGVEYGVKGQYVFLFALSFLGSWKVLTLGYSVAALRAHGRYRPLHLLGRVRRIVVMACT